MAPDAVVSSDLVAWLALGGSILSSVCTAVVAVVMFSFKRGQTEADFVTKSEHEKLGNELFAHRLNCLSRTDALEMFAPKGETAMAIDYLGDRLSEQIDNVKAQIKGVDGQVSALTARLNTGISEVITALNQPDRRHSSDVLRTPSPDVR